MKKKSKKQEAWLSCWRQHKLWKGDDIDIFLKSFFGRDDLYEVSNN